MEQSRVRIVAFSYLPMAVSTVLSAWLRCKEHAAVPFWANLAAYTLTSPLQGLIIGALSGLSAAAGVMVGKQLGRKDYAAAYAESKKLMAAGQKSFWSSTVWEHGASASPCVCWLPTGCGGAS